MREVGQKQIGRFKVTVRAYLSRHNAGEPVGKDDRYSFAFDVTREPGPNRNGQGPRIFTDRTGREFTTEEEAALAAFEYAEDVIDGKYHPLLTVADL